MLNDKDTPKKAVDATPPPIKARIAEPGEGKPDYYNTPPTDYISRYRLVDQLKATPGAAEAVVRYWKEQQIAWPEPPSEYPNYFKHLTESSKPDKYLSSIEREDSDALLGWLSKRVSDRVWKIRTADENDLDALYRWELLEQRITLEQKRRAVSRPFWEDITAIVSARLSEYPKDANWGGVAELRATVARLHQLIQNLKQYEGETEVVETKIAEFAKGWDQRVERAKKEYLEAARNHRDGTPKAEPNHGIMTKGWAAHLAEQTYLTELFRANVHHDYLKQHYDYSPPKKPIVAPPIEVTDQFRSFGVPTITEVTTTENVEKVSEQDYTKEQARLKLLLSPTADISRMDLYRTIGKLVPQDNGNPVTGGTIKSFLAKVKSGKKSFDKLSIDRICSELRNEGKDIDDELLAAIRRHQR